MSYVVSLFHIVFSTKGRIPALDANCRGELFEYMAGILKNKGCRPVIINGMADHVHILVDIPSHTPLSEIVKELKRCGTMWIRESAKFPVFTQWEREYAAFSCSATHKPKVADYILNQQSHHRNLNAFDELQNLLRKNYEQ